MSQALRQLPAVHRWLRAAPAADLCAEFGRSEVAEVMRMHLGRIRDEATKGIQPAHGLRECSLLRLAAGGRDSAPL